MRMSVNDNIVYGELILNCNGDVPVPRFVGVGEPTPMRKRLTGEPYAGEPQVRFGGGREPFSTAEFAG